MKFFVTIFAFYLLALATMPCCIFDNCPKDETEISEKNANQKNGDDDGCGVCSPFFNCGSCAVGFTAPVKFSDLSHTITVISTNIKKNIPYNQSLEDSDLSAIWQPPKNTV